jgi:hypothetical protein
MTVRTAKGTATATTIMKLGVARSITKHRQLFLGAHPIRDRRQQTADSRQQTADSR